MLSLSSLMWSLDCIVDVDMGLAFNSQLLSCHQRNSDIHYTIIDPPCLRVYSHRYVHVAAGIFFFPQLATEEVKVTVYMWRPSTPTRLMWSSMWRGRRESILTSPASSWDTPWSVLAISCAHIERVGTLSLWQCLHVVRRPGGIGWGLSLSVMILRIINTSSLVVVTSHFPYIVECAWAWSWC